MNNLWLNTRIVIFLIIAICWATSERVSEQHGHATKDFELSPGQHYQNNEEKLTDASHLVTLDPSKTEMLPKSLIDEKPIPKIRRKPPCPNNIFVAPAEKKSYPDYF